jgi:hypothetical protein
MALCLTKLRQEITVLRMPKFHYRDDVCSPVDPIFSWMNPIHNLTFNLLRSIVILSSYLGPGHSRSLTQILHTFLITHNTQTRSRYSDWLRTGRPRGRISSPGRFKHFPFSASSRPALGSTQPPFRLVPGGFYPGVKQLGREADQCPSSAEVKKIRIYISTPLYAFIA